MDVKDASIPRNASDAPKVMQNYEIDKERNVWRYVPLVTSENETGNSSNVCLLLYNHAESQQDMAACKLTECSSFHIPGFRWEERSFGVTSFMI